MKHLFITLLLISTMFSQETIAVIDLETVGVSQTVSPTLSNIIRKTLMGSNQFIVIDRNQTDEILKEQGFQQTGCVSSECAVEVGKMLGVQNIISGSISKLGELYIIDLQLIDVSTGKIKKIESEQFVGKIEELIQPIKKVTERIAGLANRTKEQNANSIFITSEPIGAKAYIEGNFVGNTPIKIPIEAASVNIRVSLNGYSVWEQTVIINKESQNIVKASLVQMSGNINSQIEKGYLSVIGNISGWDIYLDGGNIGKTPFNERIELEVGKHKVSLFDDNHVFSSGFTLIAPQTYEKAAVKNIFLKPGEDLEVNIDSMITEYEELRKKGKTNSNTYWSCYLIAVLATIGWAVASV